MIHRDITPFPFPNDLFWKHAYPEFMSDPLGSYTGVPDDQMTSRFRMLMIFLKLKRPTIGWAYFIGI